MNCVSWEKITLHTEHSLYLVQQHEQDKEQRQFQKHKTIFGNEIVASTRRLALMNLFLHNIGDIDSDSFISPADALIASSSGERYDYVLANGRLVDLGGIGVHFKIWIFRSKVVQRHFR